MSSMDPTNQRLGKEIILRKQYSSKNPTKILQSKGALYMLSAPGSPASFTYRPPEPAAGGVRDYSCATAVGGRPRGI